MILRGWRVGGDIMGEAERIINEAEKKFKKDEQRSEGKSGNDNENNSGHSQRR